MDNLTNKFGNVNYPPHPEDSNITTQVHYFYGTVDRRIGHAWAYLCLSEMRESVRYLITDILKIVPPSYEVVVHTNLDTMFVRNDIYFFTKYLYTEHGKVTIDIASRKVVAFLEIDDAVLRDMPEEEMF